MILDRAIRNARAMMRSSEWGDSSIPPNSRANDASVLGGGSSGEAGALSIGAVLACIKALHDDTKVMPFKSYVGEKYGAHRPADVQPLIVTEPFGPDTPVNVGMAQLVVSVAMRGNAYAFGTHIDPKTGLIDQTTILHPDSVRTSRDAKGKFHMIGGNRYGPADVVHITGLMLPGAVAGVDVLTYQRLTHDLAWKVNAYADGFFGGGGSPSGVIAMPGPGDRKKIRQVKDSWQAGHAGVAKAHQPAVLFGGATWTAMSIAPENAQFLQTRRYLREEICGLYGVPLQRIQAITENAAQGGGKGLDAIDAGYVRHGLMPATTGIEVEWNRLIPGGQHSWTNFDYDEFLRASAEVRATVQSSRRTAGTRTIDELRAEDGLEAYPDGLGANPFTPLNSNASPAGGADNAPAPGSDPGGTQ
ncbi:MAG TPA: phage portal protein [Mycobacterium sp.]|uniref:phage portal protein n=1 Tax=Mycobacterium sp. TaxID=1785 RepID=UPI002F422445